MSRVSRRNRAVAAAGGVLLVGALTACSGGQPGAAAVIDGGDRVISVSEVDSATTELASLLSGVTSSTVLSVLIIEPVLGEVAAAHDVAVSADDARTQLASIASDAGLDADQEFSDSSIAVMTYVLEISALQEADDVSSISDELTAAESALDIEVNPRFGTVGSDGTLATTSYDWIVATADSDTSTESQ